MGGVQEVKFVKLSRCTGKEGIGGCNGKFSAICLLLSLSKENQQRKWGFCEVIGKNLDTKSNGIRFPD